MSRLLFILVIAVCLFDFTVGPLAGNELSSPPHPRLFNPNEDRVMVWGLPQGQARMWVERVFPNKKGNSPALCIDDLIIQGLFPFPNPTTRTGAFCLGNISMVRAHEFAATVFLSSPWAGEKSEELNAIATCTILVGGGQPPMPGLTALTDPPDLHVITCLSDDTETSLLGQFLTPDLSPGSRVYEFAPNGGGGAWWFVVRIISPIPESIGDLSPQIPR